MKKKKILIKIISIIIIVSKIMFLIPAHVTGGIRGIDEYKWINILEYNFSDVSCSDCFNYEILWSRFFIELIIVIIIVILINILIKNEI